MVRHCDEAVAKPEHALCLANRGLRFYDCRYLQEVANALAFALRR